MTQGEFKKAESLYKSVLDIREGVFGPGHPEVATTLNDLAFLYYSRNKFEKAEDVYKEALGIMESALGPDDPRVADVLESMAKLYRRWAAHKPFGHLRPWDKRDRADKLEERAKEIRSRQDQ